jgi:hypothetical protein
MAGVRSYVPISVVVLTVMALGCDTSLQVGLDNPAGSSAPDGIDPQSPNVERSTKLLDFEGVHTIRVEIPTGRVSLTQTESDGEASLKVTEVIMLKGLSNAALEEKLTGSVVTAERSFVDQARLDIEATLAEGLADADIAFDIRLAIPSGANAEILLGNGPVEVTSLTGNVEIHTAGGAITVAKVDGNLVAFTTGEDITVTDVTGNQQVETSEADITVRAAPSPTGVLSAKTTNGRIGLTIARSTATALSLSAPGGSVTTSLAGFSVSDLSTGNGLLTGVLNGGGGRIEAVAAKGEIEFVGM